MLTWYRVMHINVTAAFALTHVLVPALKRSTDASVVFTSSNVGTARAASWGAYAVSKFAMKGCRKCWPPRWKGRPLPFG